MKKIICELKGPDSKAMAYAWEARGEHGVRLIVMHRNANEGFVVLMICDAGIDGIDNIDAKVKVMLESRMREIEAADRANAGIPLSFSFIEGGMVFKTASFGNWYSDAEWLHGELRKLLRTQPMKAMEDVINDLYDFIGNLIGETGDKRMYVDASREVIPRIGNHFNSTAVTRVYIKRMSNLVMARIHFDPYDDLYGKIRKSISGNIKLHGVKNMGFKDDDLCMSCLEHRRDKADTMIGILLQSGMPGEFVDMMKDLFACD